MIVVADSGPLHYLILLEQVDLLRRFYGQVLVPEAVASELSNAGARESCVNGSRRRPHGSEFAPLRLRSWRRLPMLWISANEQPSRWLRPYVPICS